MSDMSTPEVPADCGLVADCLQQHARSLFDYLDIASGYAYAIRSAAHAKRDPADATEHLWAVAMKIADMAARVHMWTQLAERDGLSPEAISALIADEPVLRLT